MRAERPENWKELRDEFWCTFVSAERFKKLIANDDYFFLTEESDGYTRYLRVKKSAKPMTKYQMRNSRTHNIDVYIDSREICYEGKDSLPHEVLGTDKDFEELYNILRSKVVGNAWE